MMLGDRLGRRATALGLALVAVIGFAIYANAIPNGFAFDDVWIVVRNARVHTLRDQAAIWLTPYWPENGQVEGLYRPLAIFGFAIQWAIGGGNPLIFHIASALLHAAVCALLFDLLRRLTNTTAALLGAIVFAVHPVHTEAVANVVGQAELLAAAAVLAACLVHLARPVGRRSWAWDASVAGLFSAALLAKEHTIAAPALLAALDVAAGRTRDLRAHARGWLRLGTLLAACTGAYLGLRLEVLGSLRGTDPAGPIPYLYETSTRLLSAFRAWPEYARLLFWPAALSADYSPAVILPVRSPTPMAMLGAALLLLTIATAAAIHRRPGIGLPAAWFLISIAPVSNLLFPIGVLVAERTLYLPSAAVALGVASAAASPALRTLHSRTRRVAVAALCTAIAALGARTIARNPVWKDNDRLFTTLLREHPESYRGQWLAAAVALARGDTLRSEWHWELAYRLWDGDAAFRAEFAMFNIERGRYDRAIAVLERSRTLPLGRIERILAMAYLHAGRPADALAATDRALRRGVRTVGLLDVRARALTVLGRHAEAAKTWREALRLPQGDIAPYWRYLAGYLLAAGDSAAAAAALDTARTRPLYPPATVHQPGP